MIFKSRLTRSRRHRRRGQTLAEFAVVTLVLYLLVGGILTFGYAIYAAQGLQQAVDVAAREISRTPLPPELRLDDETISGADDSVLYGDAATVSAVRSRIFDERYLVLTVDDPSASTTEQSFNGGLFIADLPVVNQQLFPLMISDFIDDSGTSTLVIRYPGRVYADPNPIDANASGFLVDIPLTSGGTVPVVEEIDSTANPDPFQLSSTHRGLVALRINYPWHSPFLSGFTQDSSNPPLNEPVDAESNSGLSQGSLGTGFGPYTGERGFGRQNAMGREVRPFRKLISAQAIYRREVIAP